VWYIALNPTQGLARGMQIQADGNELTGAYWKTNPWKNVRYIRKYNRPLRSITRWRKTQYISTAASAK